jgi:hypothetical protein
MKSKEGITNFDSSVWGSKSIVHAGKNIPEVTTLEECCFA